MWSVRPASGFWCYGSGFEWVRVWSRRGDDRHTALLGSSEVDGKIIFFRVLAIFYGVGISKVDDEGKVLKGQNDIRKFRNSYDHTTSCSA